MKKLPWFDNWENKFRACSCATVKKYIVYHTGLKNLDVHKTNRYLTVNYSVNGKINIHKIDLPAGVLYLLSEKDFLPLIEEIKNEMKNANKEEDGGKLKKLVGFMRDLGITLNDPYDFHIWIEDNCSHSDLFSTGLFEEE